ncbi:MAG: protein kinase [Vulcanimicrobiota bacterium]
MTLCLREMLQDRYEVVRNIKSGGMGSVYEAVDHKLASTPCAIKEVLASALEGRDGAYILQSFESEMRALAGLEHPNIPRVRDYFEIEGRRYIVLDLVRGQALDDELAEHLRLTNEPMDPAVAAVDMVQVLETLTYLHQCRPPIIHRDIKSANLIRDSRSGRIKLVDFGIARSVETQRVQTQVGTPGFCAPEQMGGRAEIRSDLFSVGATLYHLCTGRIPPAYTFDALEMDLPRHPGLVKIVLKATQPKPQDRYASAEEMAAALRAWLRNEGSTKIDPQTLPPAAQTRVNPLAVAPVPPNTQNGLWVAVAAMLLAAFGLLYSDYSSRFSSSPAAPAKASSTPTTTRVYAHPSPTPKLLAHHAQESPRPKPRTPQPVPRKAQPRPQPKPVVTPRIEKPPSLEPESNYPTRQQPDYHPPAARQPASEPPAERASDPVGFSARPTSGGNKTLENMPSRVGPLVRSSNPGDRMYQRYQGRIGNYDVSVGISAMPGRSVDQIRQWAQGQMGPLQRNPNNEAPGEYCGWRVQGNQHEGLHVKEGLAYHITVVPPPSSEGSVWGPVMELIHRYP